MSNGGETLCISCGLPAGEPLRMNHLPNGTPCSSCRDRLLDSLGSALPADLMRVGESHPVTEGEEPHMASPRIAPGALDGPAEGESGDSDHDSDDGGYKPSA